MKNFILFVLLLCPMSAFATGLYDDMLGIQSPKDYSYVPPAKEQIIYQNAYNDYQTQVIQERNREDMQNLEQMNYDNMMQLMRQSESMLNR